MNWMLLCTDGQADLPWGPVRVPRASVPGQSTGEPTLQSGGERREQERRLLNSLGRAAHRPLPFLPAGDPLSSVSPSPPPALGHIDQMQRPAFTSKEAGTVPGGPRQHASCLLPRRRGQPPPPSSVTWRRHKH